MPPSFYSIVADALDDMNSSLRPHHQDLDKDVHDAIVSRSYLGLDDPKVPLPDYSQDIARMGYVFTYVAAHAGYTYNRLSKYSGTFHEYFDAKPNLIVTSLGGGPGSDLLGLLAYFIDNHHAFQSIHCFRCDRVANWSDFSKLILRQRANQANAVVQDMTVDVTQPTTYSTKPEIFHADVFIASYFLSELAKNLPQSYPFWDEMKSRARQGALFLVVDNDSDAFIPNVDIMLNRAGFTRIMHECEKLTHSENKAPLESYINRYDRRPRMYGQVYFAIYRKN